MNVIKKRVASILLVLVADHGVAADTKSFSGDVSYSSLVNQAYPREVYWGDTHLHTNLSVDANGMGNKFLSPDDAYRFAKGEPVQAHNGQQAQLSRPLDFLVVADHGSNMGVMPALAVSDPALLRTEAGKRWYEEWGKAPLNINEVLNSPDQVSFERVLQSTGFNAHGPQNFFWRLWFGEQQQIIREEDFRRSTWAEVVRMADLHNRPENFTAFSGYEWTSGIYHRVVVFKDAAEKVARVLPFTSQDSMEPEQLWAYMAAYEADMGGEVLAIPHNGNLSNGSMFSLQDSAGRPLDKTYAEKRSRWEPLIEVTQIKGDSETHPVLSPNDEFANYETWYSWAGGTMEGVQTPGWKKRKEFEYARSALKHGLNQQVKIGGNPFKFGMIGSTDAHTSLATADENNFWGKLTLHEPTPYRMRGDSQAKDEPKLWEFAASGYAAIWAEENTRESLFAAMKRKEVYATTGPRITVRFFGGWNYKTNDAFRPDLARIGYDKGVPMGGDLTSPPNDQAPTFLIRAVKDPDGANLDRVQVIKGWHDANGDLHENIYNVALSDGRKDKGTNTKPVGNTVDIPDASYTNTIGDAELSVVWQDPDFDPNELAFYYLRVLEIPTPRWTAYDAKYFQLTDLPEEIPMVTQERAYSSPIWYTP